MNDTYLKNLLIDMEYEINAITDGLEDCMRVEISLRATANALKILVELLRYTHTGGDNAK